ncbi:hypothetical protein [Synechococcus sp. CS-603]|uniref:hypothetical protein n=1 Tax=Synechococcus sp. CS-603 TaxID=2847981 RepID=UPI00223B1020|nr:hypothetical protein [Synechococcus sp. CS-603]MCT0201773.1 hypothetical protein [Synechococcus sp. CS-603]
MTPSPLTRTKLTLPPGKALTGKELTEIAVAVANARGTVKRMKNFQNSGMVVNLLPQAKANRNSSQTRSKTVYQTICMGIRSLERQSELIRKGQDQNDIVTLP